MEAFICQQSTKKNRPFPFISQYKHTTRSAPSLTASLFVKRARIVNEIQLLNSQSESDGPSSQKDKDCDKCNTPSSSNATLPTPLEPFLAAYDPAYSVRGPIGEGDFTISRANGPTQQELMNENLYKVLKIECTDLEVNTLVWKALGYRFHSDTEEWTNDFVFPKWKMNFPTPPDLIGMKRVYSKEVDTPSLKANQQLVRSIPMEFKQSLKTHLRPLGFTGYKYEELTPNKTRRAQCVNWLLYYREELFGFSVDELRERKRLKEKGSSAQEENIVQTDPEQWTSPVKEVFIE
jgi:hypothetical protein